MTRGAIQSSKNVDLLHRLWSAFPEEREKLRPYVEKAKSYRNECGCTMGGVFLIGSLMLFLINGTFFHRISSGPWPVTTFRAIGFTFGTSILGKLTGIAVARIRLAFMYKKLRIQFHIEGD